LFSLSFYKEILLLYLEFEINNSFDDINQFKYQTFYWNNWSDRFTIVTIELKTKKATCYI